MSIATAIRWFKYRAAVGDNGASSHAALAEARSPIVNCMRRGCQSLNYGLVTIGRPVEDFFIRRKDLPGSRSGHRRVEACTYYYATGVPGSRSTGLSFLHWWTRLKLITNGNERDSALRILTVISTPSILLPRILFETSPKTSTDPERRPQQQRMALAETSPSAIIILTRVYPLRGSGSSVYTHAQAETKSPPGAFQVPQ